jgi:hypothetical protein
VLLNVSGYRSLLETIDTLSDADSMEQIESSRKFFAAGKRGLSFEEVFGVPLGGKKQSRRG